MEYKYMVEYPFTGTKPDLPGDVLIDVKLNNGVYINEWTDSPRRIANSGWTDQEVLLAWRIVDERYNIPDWTVNGSYPPVGTHCEFSWGSLVSWHECILLPDNYIASKKSNHEWVVNHKSEFDALTFRPIKTEQEKVIEAVASALGEDCPEPEVLNKLWEIGALKIPTKEPK